MCKHPGESNRHCLFSATVDPSDFTALSTPVAFVCIVEGERLEATITHVHKHEAGCSFRLCFSDGHAADFLAVPDEKDRKEEALDDSPYAAAVSIDLCTVCTFELKNLPFAIAASNEGKHFNVWVNPEGGGYRVYYERKFRFHLQRRSKKWNVTPGENYDREAHKEIVEAVTYRLETTR